MVERAAARQRAREEEIERRRTEQDKQPTQPSSTWRSARHEEALKRNEEPVKRTEEPIRRNDEPIRRTEEPIRRNDDKKEPWRPGK